MDGNPRGHLARGACPRRGAHGGRCPAGSGFRLRALSRFPLALARRDYHRAGLGSERCGGGVRDPGPGLRALPAAAGGCVSRGGRGGGAGCAGVDGTGGVAGVRGCGVLPFDRGGGSGVADLDLAPTEARPPGVRPCRVRNRSGASLSARALAICPGASRGVLQPCGIWSLLSPFAASIMVATASGSLEMLKAKTTFSRTRGLGSSLIMRRRMS